MKVTIAKSFSFEAAHFLPEHKGKCQNLHGHRWEGEVRLSSSDTKLIEGMVMDFADVSAMLKALVVEKYDHTLMNTLLPTPTCENMALKIFEDLSIYIRTHDLGVQLESIMLKETEGNYCEVRRWKE